MLGQLEMSRSQFLNTSSSGLFQLHGKFWSGTNRSQLEMTKTRLPQQQAGNEMEMASWDCIPQKWFVKHLCAMANRMWGWTLQDYFAISYKSRLSFWPLSNPSRCSVNTCQCGKERNRSQAIWLTPSCSKPFSVCLHVEFVKWLKMFVNFPTNWNHNVEWNHPH